MDKIKTSVFLDTRTHERAMKAARYSEPRRSLSQWVASLVEDRLGRQQRSKAAARTRKKVKAAEAATGAE